MGFFEQFKKQQLIASHRGFRALYPENTVLAFKKSLNKCDFLEFDIQFTKDDIPVVFHDNKLIRTSNAKQLKEFKSPYYLWDYTYKQLQTLDISSWFYENDPFFQKSRLKKPKRIQKIPTLEEVIIFAKQHQLPINIEIKYKATHLLNEKQLQKIIHIIHNHSYEKHTLISSFCHEYIKSIKQINPIISTAALAHKKFPNDLVLYLKQLRVEAYHINEKLATKKLIKQLTENGFIVNVYTINNRQKQEKLFYFGVYSIFTDFL